MAALNFDRVQLIVANRVKPLDPGGHIAIGNALHFQFMHATKFGNLTEGQRGVINQPNGSGLGHQRLGHRFIPLAFARKGGPLQFFPKPGKRLRPGPRSFHV